MYIKTMPKSKIVLMPNKEVGFYVLISKAGKQVIKQLK